MPFSQSSVMGIKNMVKRLYNRYTALIMLLVAMLYTHTSLIQIHPLLFIVWPTSLWLIIEIYAQWKKKPIRIFLFTATFTLHLLATQMLVVENTSGIFFDLNPFPNMATISYYVLGVSVALFLHDAYVSKRMSFVDIPAYVGFATVIPWVSPAIVEVVILARWVLDGSFALRTVGKGLGAASLNDILFIYGSRNLEYSIVLFYAFIMLLRFTDMIFLRSEFERDRMLLMEKEREWFEHAWENPLTLLSPSDRSSFIKEYNHLEAEQRNNVLREKILPEKGIRLIDPEASPGWSWRGRH